VDKIDGILADARLFNIPRKIEFAVKAGHVDVHLEPRFGADGRLEFGPVRTELVADTSDAIPEVRNAVIGAINALGEDVESQLQRALDDHQSEFADWLANQLAVGARLTAIDVQRDRAVFRAEAAATPEDVTGDGRVDIIDLVAVARQFGQRGPSGFSPADLNRDGVVDIVDLVRIARRMVQ